MSDPWLKQVTDIFEASIETKKKVLSDHLGQTIVDMAEVIADSLRDGGKLLICGNGGSAADAQHLAAELIVRLRSSCDRDGLPALTLATDTSTITACANDYGYDFIYERALRALGRSGDVLLGITTSGKSPNVIKALEAAEDMRITRLGFLGGDGGPALAHCNLAFVVPATDTGRIQESHITAGHALMQLVEEMLLASGDISRTDDA